MLDKIVENWKRLCDENPDIRQAVREGYEVGAYDEETGVIICMELVDGAVKMRIIEDGYFIKKSV